VILLAWLFACSSAPEPKVPPPSSQAERPSQAAAHRGEGEVPLGNLSPAAVSGTIQTQIPAKLTPELAEARAALAALVARDAGSSVQHPWALGHAVMALGPDLRVGDELAVDAIPREWGQVGPDGAIGFPASAGGVPVEPHPALFLKEYAELGLSPDKQAIFAGHSYPLADLWRSTLHRTWADKETTSYGAWNAMAWALHGIALWAPTGVSWDSTGHQMDLNTLTDQFVWAYKGANLALTQGMKTNTPVQKRGQGIFGWSCGGAHAFQSALVATSLGLGSDQSRAAMQEQIDVLFWRYGMELAQTDSAIEQAPQYMPLILVQRLKFVGHFLESVHRASALGVMEATPERQAIAEKAMQDLIDTVQMVKKQGYLADPSIVKKARHQSWLDLLGDSAHAIHAIDMATGHPMAHPIVGDAAPR